VSQSENLYVPSNLLLLTILWKSHWKYVKIKTWLIIVFHYYFFEFDSLSKVFRIHSVSHIGFWWIKIRRCCFQIGFFRFL
jgi:hypothetical protein